MNRVDRLFALVLFLQARRVATAEQMAAHFELSLRTIYRDLAALGEAGVPIVAEAGVGYSLMRGYRLPPVNFTVEEASAMVTGGLLAEQSTDRSVRTQLHSALRKIRAILPREHQERVLRLEQGLGTTANIQIPPQADLSLLQEALSSNRVVRFAYQRANQAEPTERMVEPCGLLHYLSRWHLIAWCRTAKDYRDFRTDRMKDVRLLADTFTPHPDFSLTDYIGSMPKPELRARIQFTPGAADRAKREWWLGIVAEESVQGAVVLTLAAVAWENLVGWLLSFGTQAVVLEPENLRELLINAAEAAAAHHRGNSEIPKVC